MTHYKRLMQILAWLAVIAWMIVIFSMSNQKAEDSSDLSTSTTEKILTHIYPDFEKLPEAEQHELVANTEHATRKTAHMTEFFILSALITTALLFNKMEPFKRAAAAVGICCAYAVTDELHQLFINGRSSRATDVLIDTLGAAAFAAIYLLAALLINKRRKKKLMQK